MLKISRDGTVSDSADVREHPGVGEPVTAVEHPADDTVPPGTGDDEAPADVQPPEPAPAPVPVTPPRTPPRRTPPKAP